MQRNCLRTPEYIRFRHWNARTTRGVRENQSRKDTFSRYWAFGSQTGRTKINHVIYEGNEEENATCWGCNDAIRASRKYTDWAGTNISNKDMVQF